MRAVKIIVVLACVMPVLLVAAVAASPVLPFCLAGYLNNGNA